MIFISKPCGIALAARLCCFGFIYLSAQNNAKRATGDNFLSEKLIKMSVSKMPSGAPREVFSRDFMTLRGAPLIGTERARSRVVQEASQAPVARHMRGKRHINRLETFARRLWTWSKPRRPQNPSACPKRGNCKRVLSKYKSTKKWTPK